MAAPKKFQPRVIRGELDSSSTSDRAKKSNQGPLGVVEKDSQSNMISEARQELIRTLKGDIEELMAMDENEVHKKYEDLISWDNDAKLYLGSRSFRSTDGKCYLGWPDYVKVNMREKIRTLLEEKIRKLMGGASTLPKLSE